MESLPGKRSFQEEKEATEFACERLKENWIVHLYRPRDKGDWFVEWWCF